MPSPKETPNPELDPAHAALAKLLRNAQAGDRAAFDTLFTRYERMVYATALRRLGHAQAAHELCQEVAIRAMRKIGQLREPASFGTWLGTIADRMAVNRIVRHKKRRTVSTEELAGQQHREESPLGHLLAQERRDQVRRGLARLAPLDRDTLVAFYFEGQSLNQMSGVFNSPVGTIKRRLHVARKRLAKQLAGFASA